MSKLTKTVVVFMLVVAMIFIGAATYAIKDIDLTKFDQLYELIERVEERIDEEDVVVTEGETIPGIPEGFTFDENMRQGDRGTDVQYLQVALNHLGFTVTDSGPGSPGNETEYFGSLTGAAVIKFQEAYTDEILVPLRLTSGTGNFYTYTRTQMNAFIMEEEVVKPEIIEMKQILERLQQLTVVLEEIKERDEVKEDVEDEEIEEEIVREDDKYLLTLKAGTGGSITTGSSDWYEEDTPISIEATPAEGYAFVNWTGDDEHIINAVIPTDTVTMPSADVDLTANFVKDGITTSSTTVISDSGDDLEMEIGFTGFIAKDTEIEITGWDDSWISGNFEAADFTADNYNTVELVGYNASTNVLTLKAFSDVAAGYPELGTIVDGVTWVDNGEDTRTLEITRKDYGGSGTFTFQTDFGFQTKANITIDESSETPEEIILVDDEGGDTTKDKELFLADVEVEDGGVEISDLGASLSINNQVADINFADLNVDYVDEIFSDIVLYVDGEFVESAKIIEAIGTDGFGNSFEDTADSHSHTAEIVFEDIDLVLEKGEYEFSIRVDVEPLFADTHGIAALVLMGESHDTYTLIKDLYDYSTATFDGDAMGKTIIFVTEL